MINRVAPEPKRHDLPPLEPKKTEKNGQAPPSDFKLPEVKINTTPMPSRKRYRMTNRGWVEEPNYKASQKGTAFFDVLYDGKKYWSLSPTEDWIPFSREQIQVELRGNYKLWAGRIDDGLNDVQQILKFIDKYNRVEVVTKLGGYSTGIYCVSPGSVILIPSGFVLPEPSVEITDDIIW